MAHSYNVGVGGGMASFAIRINTQDSNKADRADDIRIRRIHGCRPGGRDVCEMRDKRTK